MPLNRNHLDPIIVAEQDEWQRLESQLSGSDLGSRSLELSGLSFTAAISDGLFLWGNALLYRYEI